MSTCLLITYGPVPTDEYQTVEGGGMRIHGLALGLKANGIDVTVAVYENFPQSIDESEGIKLVNWRPDNDFVKLLNSFNSVIVSYSMGDLSKFVRDNINDDVQLILDAYVPAYIEVSARESKDIETEYKNYFLDLPKYNHTLERGDYFLVANHAQAVLYTGVLSALGVINPASYRLSRIIDAPFGIQSTPVKMRTNPYSELGIADTDFVVLWFGGLYPWFRIEEYLEAIRQLSSDKTVKFVFVGGKNPNNGHPDFAIQYETAVAYVAKHSLQATVYFVDWVDFKDRGDWYVNADIIVSLNQAAEENKYSWRTRVMDFIWGEAPILTNGGDPLSEELISNSAALRLERLTSDDIVRALRSVRSDPKLLETMKTNVRTLKQKYYWENITETLAKVVDDHTLPFYDESKLRSKVSIQSGAIVPGRENPLKKTARLTRKTLRYAKSKGLKRTAAAVVRTTNRRLKVARSTRSNEPQFVFISHPLDNTGAPLVLMNIIEEFVARYGSNRIRVIAPGTTINNYRALKKLGIGVEKAVEGVGFRAVRLQLGLRPNDFVFINTSAVYHNYLQFVLLWLKLGRLKHAYWFIHEDINQSAGLIKLLSSQLQALLKDHRLTLFFPSIKTAAAYKKILGSKSLKAMVMRTEVDKRLRMPRDAADFDTLRFLISGTTTDGRKGQFIAISAFQRFLDVYYKGNESAYRPFSLTLLSVATNDYPSQQVRMVAKSALGDHVTIYKNMERVKALKIARESNVVICSSLHETYALYVAESMQMGSIVLRNDVGGVDEQLQDGVNGYAIVTEDVTGFSNIIEKMLNKKTTANDDLLTMSNQSLRIAEDFNTASYLEQILHSEKSSS